MKKIKQTIFWALVAVAAASCKKEGTLETPVSQKAISEQVAELIQKGDPEAYEKLYGSGRAPVATIKVTHGVFHYSSGGPVDGTCLPDPNCVCHITIEWARLVTEHTDSTNVTEDFHGAYTQNGEAEIILNDGSATTIQNLKSVDIVFDDMEGSTLDYDELD